MCRQHITKKPVTKKPVFLELLKSSLNASFSFLFFSCISCGEGRLAFIYFVMLLAVTSAALS